MKKRGEIVQTGDFIQFVICKKNDQDEQKKSEPFIPKAPGDMLANKAQIGKLVFSRKNKTAHCINKH